MKLIFPKINIDSQILRATVEGHKDSASHARGVTLKTNVSNPESAKLVEASVKSMHAGIPKLESFDTMDKQDEDTEIKKPRPPSHELTNFIR